MSVARRPCAAPLIPVLDASQAAHWDEVARENGSASRVLMEAAGRGVAQVAAREFGPHFPHGVLAVVGHGNNGGDGWVAARALRAVGARVWVAEHERDRSPDCAANRALALADGVELVATAQWPRVDLVVDALLGTGASGAPRGAIGELAARLTQAGAPIVAVDGPTGLDLSTGEAHGPIHASCTVTFGGLRRGHLLGRAWCGKIVVLDIGFGPIPDPTWPRFVDDTWAASVLPTFAADMHKGGRGRVLIVGGEHGMAGAVHYAARAALGAGAGLVRIAAHAASVAALQRDLPDVTATESGLGPTLESSLRSALEWADAIVLGPGLGRGADRSRFVHAVLEASDAPTVIDADALHAGLGALAAGSAPRVLTPHLGEFRAAFGVVSDPERDRWDATVRAAQTLADRRGHSNEARDTILLKGVPTIVADGRDVRVVGSGNPGLATGGSGDLLAGFIATFLARSLDGLSAACLGAQVLGRAAEIAVRTSTVASLRPADVIAALPHLWRRWREPRRVQPPVMLDLDPPAVE